MLVFQWLLNYIKSLLYYLLEINRQQLGEYIPGYSRTTGQAFHWDWSLSYYWRRLISMLVLFPFGLVSIGEWNQHLDKIYLKTSSLKQL